MFFANSLVDSSSSSLLASDVEKLIDPGTTVGFSTSMRTVFSESSVVKDESVSSVLPAVSVMLLI